MPVLIDGNNLLHRLAPARANREEVRRLLLDACREQRMLLTVVFDGPPPGGVPDQERLGLLTVLYSGADSADDVIVRRLPAGRAARSCVVVTDDHGLAARAGARGAEVRGVREWLGRRRPPPLSRAASEPRLSSRELADWEEYFSRDRPPEPD